MADPKLLGMTRPFDWRGKTYQVSPRDFEMEANLRVWLEREALQAIKRHKDAMDLDDYREQLAGWRRDCAAGVYSYAATTAALSMQSIPGQKHFVWLSLVRADNSITPHLVDELYEDTEAWAELCEILIEMNFPNSTKPPKEEAPAA